MNTKKTITCPECGCVMSIKLKDWIDMITNAFKKTLEESMK